MKKFLFIIFALTLCLFAVSFEKQEISANTENKGDLVSTEIEYLEDGSYLVTEHFSSEESNITRSNMRTVLHEYTVTHYSAANTVLWIYVLTGGWYVVDGVSVQAMSSLSHVTLKSNAWSFHDPEDTYHDNIVHGSGNFKFKVLGITAKTIYIDLNMECDVYGNLVEED